jgi:hypothetical protein
MEKQKEGLMEILNGEGANSENKLIKYATYAVSTIIIGGVCYAVYKSVKNSKEIEALRSQIERGVVTTAPISDDVVSL